ncbi:MAG: hypothetical protein HN337_05400 [Deltaproteobacteria bacterium]|nr:hypothetical protein [Deltaproteobacteria bacterium]
MIRRIPRFIEGERDGLASGREKLLIELEDYGARMGVQIAVVFDGGTRPHSYVGELPSFEGFAGIDVFFSKRGQSADQNIVEIAGGILKKKRYRGVDVEEMDVIVVSDDIILNDDVKELGAYLVSPASLEYAMRDLSIPKY